VFLRESLVERDQTLADALKPTCTVEEFPSYIWATPTSGKAAKDEPVKLDDHGMDTTRYLVADVDLRPEVRVRWL
jgi:phage terminase large subunit